MLTRNDLQQIRNIFQDEINPVKKDIKSLKHKLNDVAKDVKYITKDYDERIVANTREIEKLKN